MADSVSPGSSQRGASVTCAATFTWPSGAAAASGANPDSVRIETARNRMSDLNVLLALGPEGRPAAGSERSTAIGHHPEHAERGHGPREAPEGECAHLFGLDQALHGRGHPGRNQHLAPLGFTAQSRGQVGDGADGTVVPAPLETDGADGRVSLSDADAKREVPAAPAPAGGQLAHLI